MEMPKITGEYIDNWNYKLAGRVICIRRKGQFIRVGQVEIVSANGDFLWLRREGVEPRALFDKVEGYTAWALPDAPMLETPIDHFMLLAD
ncbi:hypothetical protein FDW83_17775 [Pseudarthrobacter sp. NamE2]|uniref:hypothetical protein n=1 Tax=Pseudarthrobacter sp. NamE2 TaxID=2576838 RepID=UPI0010FEBAD9|nr:hypothetical protein [Pseudarthrobacter sp. NamE2]TLM81105.1 hypothetical protein FDW83_17775 [Pseudarthrobacter sp. NamE2]